jgi:hypothetical protein
MARRLAHLERQTVSDQWGIVPIVDPERWPDVIRAAYDAAGEAGDWEVVAAIVETQTGTRPSPERRDGSIWLIEIGHAAQRTDGVAE